MQSTWRAREIATSSCDFARGMRKAWLAGACPGTPCAPSPRSLAKTLHSEHLGMGDTDLDHHQIQTLSDASLDLSLLILRAMGFDFFVSECWVGPWQRLALHKTLHFIFDIYSLHLSISRTTSTPQKFIPIQSASYDRHESRNRSPVWRLTTILPPQNSSTG